MSEMSGIESDLSTDHGFRKKKLQIQWVFFFFFRNTQKELNGKEYDTIKKPSTSKF
jgi:hypothetical protein